MGMQQVSVLSTFLFLVVDVVTDLPGACAM